MVDRCDVLYRYNIIISLLLYSVLISSIIVGQNLIDIFGIKIATGVLIFPFTYLLVAIATEYFGAKNARQIILTTAFCNGFMVMLIYIFMKIPSNQSFLGSSTLYHNFLERLAYLLMISSFAFLISENMNIWLIGKLKILTNGRFLLVRTFLSTAGAIALDTALIFPFFFTRQDSIVDAVLEMLLVLSVKLLYNLALMPIFWTATAIVNFRISKNNNLLPATANPYTASHYISTNDDRIST